MCTCRLNWAKRTSWGWWDEWDDTALQTQDSRFELWRSEAEHVTFRSRRFPTTCPDNTSRWTNSRFILAHRQSNMKPALFKHVVFCLALLRRGVSRSNVRGGGGCLYTWKNIVRERAIEKRNEMMYSHFFSFETKKLQISMFKHTFHSRF